MKINSLELTNVRGFTHANLEFQPGFNLLVGINGVGKTTVLDVLRVMMSHSLKEIGSPVISKEYFSKSDININTDHLYVSANFTLGGDKFDFIYSKASKDTYIKVVETRTSQNKALRREKEGKERDEPQDNKTSEEDNNKKIDNSNLIPSRLEGVILEDIIEFKPNLKKINLTEFALFFSTRRSLMVNQTPKVVKSGKFNAAAYVDALSETRAFNIKMFAEWFNVRRELAKATPKHEKLNQLIENAIYAFLPGFSNLDLIKDEISNDLTFCITKSNKLLNFNQLSDGERGVLALVFDIARRLSIAYHNLENPLEGEAIILIDELDLHLHPKWQRTIVGDLERTFPNCQFIATTHSPQIIGEVSSDAITIIDRNDEREVYKPTVAFGLDAQRILEELLDSPIRNIEINKQIITISKKVDDEKFAEAKKLILQLQQTVGELDPELIRLNSMINFLEEGFSNEEDN